MPHVRIDFQDIAKLRHVRARVQPIDDGGQLPLSESRQAGALRQILTEWG